MSSYWSSYCSSYRSSHWDVIRRLARRGFASIAFAIGLAAMASPASAGLVFDIRLTGGCSPFAIPTQIGQVFNFEIFATVTGGDTDLSNDTFRSAVGYLRSSGGTKVDLAHQLDPVFAGAGASAGTVADRDGDGDLDVGGAGTATDTPGQIRYRALNPVSGPGSFRLGTGTFTVKQLGSPGQISFFVATPSVDLNPIFTIDGVAKNGALNPGEVSVASSITLGVPAPPFPRLVSVGGVPDSPTFTLNVVKAGPNHYVTPNPLNAGEELPAGGISSGGVVINGIAPGDSPIFVLLGLNISDGLDGFSPGPAGGPCGTGLPFTMISEQDPQFIALKQQYPWLDALVMYSATDGQNVVNFDFSSTPGLMLTEVAAVPEPAALTLASLLALPLLTRRRA